MAKEDITAKYGDRKAPNQTLVKNHKMAEAKVCSIDSDWTALKIMFPKSTNQSRR